MKLFLTLLLVLTATQLNAQFNAGGTITSGDLVYQYLGKGAQPNTSKYTISLYTSADCSSTKFPDANPGRIFFSIYSDSFYNIIIPDAVASDSTVTLVYTPLDQCQNYREKKCMETRRFRLIIDLPIIEGDYVVTTSLIGRRTTLIRNTQAGPGIFVTSIPGTKKTGLNRFNSSPSFVYPTEQTVCAATSFSMDLSNKDVDGDVLQYQFSHMNTYDIREPYPMPPPYKNLPFVNDYSAEDEPIGPYVKLDNKSGILIGVAPEVGYYRIGIKVKEYRNGELLNEHTKETLVYASHCQKARAWLKDEYSQCNSFTFKFRNEFQSTFPVKYRWDFGVPNRSNDTSTLPEPSFTYPDTGIYKLKLFIYNGDCTDSASSIVKVYPGFKPGFVAKIACVSLPVQFIDTSKTPYGFINSWSWNFGDNYSAAGTSSIQNPSYQYSTASSYNVRQIVTSSVGCRDTAYLNLTAYSKMFIGVSNDTTICGLDTIPLKVTGGNGVITWSPNVLVSNREGQLVSPDTTTLYKVSVVAGPGCSAEDSVLVKVIDGVDIKASAARQICLGDSVHLTATSANADKFKWTPSTYTSGTLEDKSLVAKPTNHSTYTVTASIGSCIAKDSVSIQVHPYPKADVYGDTTICYGKTVQFGVVGNADMYVWSPSKYLVDVHASNHLVAPDRSINYTLEAKNLAGCTKPVYKNVSLNITYPVKAFAGNDTAVIVGQSLQLNAQGGDHYEWSPIKGLSNPYVATPISILNESINYKLKVTTNDGCVGYDSIKVRVFNTEYDIFVPTAFTPNRDGLNDIFKPTPVGILDSYLFTVYNRWGQLIFKTSTSSIGWDGFFKGVEAPTGSYIWQVKGTAVSGKKIERKGSVMLFR